MNKKAKKPVGPKAKITFRHNFLPVILGVSMFGSTLGLLNGQWIEAQAQYRFAPKVSAAATDTAVYTAAPNKNNELLIPGIKVDAPVVTDVPDYTEWKIQLGLREGVVHLPQTALPGQKGNVVIVGHSSGQIWAPGNYKFVFTLLNKVQKSDLIMFDYQGTRYIYRVASTEVIEPTNFSVIQPTDDPELTLITCTPVGTSKNRLVVHARQISPHPNSAQTVKNHDLTIDPGKLPQ